MANPQSDLIGGEEDFAAMLEESFKGKGTTKGGDRIRQRISLPGGFSSAGKPP